MKKYDLTTSSGVKNAIDTISKFDPVFMLAKMAFDKLSSSKDQGEITNELIRRGKENGVKEMEIIVDNMKGIDGSFPMEDGREIITKVGSDEKIHIKVIYK